MKKHDSLRGYFAYELHQAMAKDEHIWLITGDLGFLMFDSIKDDFPNRYINTGAAEQAMLDVAVGIALKGDIPVVYSITPFLLYRPFESIRNYINHEEIPVKLVGSGRDTDYAHDGISHWSTDAKDILSIFKNIKTYWPDDKEEITENYIHEILYNKVPSFLSLRR